MQCLLHRWRLAARRGHPLPKRDSKIEFRSKLSQSGGHINGTWEERTYNAEGTASGQAASGNINLAISGGVTGSMLVSFGASRQSVSISTQGIALKGVSIDLTRN